METVRVKNLWVGAKTDELLQGDQIQGSQIQGSQIQGSQIQGSVDTRVCVSRVSFSLKAGETLALVGKNGAGKSLTIMALMDALPPNLWRHAEELIIAGGRPSIMMQNAADCFDPLFTVRHVFWETLPSSFDKATREETARRLLDEVGLAYDVLDLYPFELSGGMLHRLMFALALAPILLEANENAQATRLLLADEPLAGLDVPAKVHFLHRIKELQQKYVFSMIFIDHNFASVQALAHKVLVMHDGVAVEYGDTESVSQKPRHDATQALVHAAREHALERIPHPAGMARDTASPVLYCQSVSKSYARRTAWFRAAQRKTVLSDITFQLQRGEGLGLVGMNGAGKSTLTRLLLGLDACDDGHVSILGEDLSTLLQTSAWRTRIQPVFQHARMAVNERLTVENILKEPLRAHGMGVAAQQDRVEELLALVALPTQCARSYPSQLSGGQLQRLCFARALALKPDILLLDEAFTDMDVATCVHLQDLLLSLQKERGLSYICISHNMHTLLRLCHNIMLLHDGRIGDYFPSAHFTAPERHAVFAQMCGAAQGNAEV